jgi:hypothetical protein
LEKSANPLPNKEYRYTKYFWLVNLNQAAYTKRQSEYFAQLLEQAVLHVFTSGDVVAFAAPDGPRWNRNYIGNNMLQIHIEVGPKMSRIHAHVIQEIKHRTVLNIDQQDARDAINEYISERTGGRVDKCFVSKKIHPSAMPLEEYADKDNKDWKHTGEVPSIHSTYILEMGGKSSRAEIEEEEEEEEFRTRRNIIINIDTRTGVEAKKKKRKQQLKGLLRGSIETPRASTAGGNYDPESSQMSATSVGTYSLFPMAASSSGRVR